MKNVLRTTVALPALLAITFSACAPTGSSPELETRTYSLETLHSAEVEAIIAPYIYTDREGNPGTVSAAGGVITVRETADNLAKIERVIAEYDAPSRDIRLQFQLIEADGFTDADPAIADVEAELRRLLRHEGYRLVGEGVVRVTSREGFSQYLGGVERFSAWRVSGTVLRRGPDSILLSSIELGVGGEPFISTSVNVRLGQTLVLGTAEHPGLDGAIVLVVRAVASQ